MNRDRELILLGRRARQALARLRLNEALGSFAKWLPLVLSYGAVSLAAIKVLEPALWVERGLLAGLLLLGVLVAGLLLQPLLRVRSPLVGAQALDRHHGLADRITSALEFEQIATAARTELMEAAISDGATHAAELDPRRAVPVRLPLELLTSLALAAIVVILARVEVARPRVELRSLPPSVAPLLLSSDDLDLLRELREDLQQKTDDPQISAAARRFNQLLEDIGQGRLDRHQVFSKIEEIDRELLKLNAGKAEAVEQGLEGLATELRKSSLSKPVADALDQRNLADAERALRELSQKLKHKGAVDGARLAELRRALEAASKKSSERKARLDAQRQQVEADQDKLLKKKAAGKSLTPNEAAGLEQRGRQLERLERQRQSAEAVEQELTALDRELAEAARKLLDAMPKGAEHLERGAADLNRMAREQMSENEKRQLKERLEELRELLRQQGKGGADREERMQRFARRARGQSDEPANAGKSKNGEKRLSFDRSGGGVSLALPTAGKQIGASERSGSGSGESGGAQWGNESDPSLKGDKTKLGGKLQDVSAAGIDTGQGSSVSSVVYGAAERGFAGTGYRKVYTDYKTVAEEAIERDRIPSGYESYVRRYFQLIRPRE
jgi:hypothetical protein